MKSCIEISVLNFLWSFRFCYDYGYEILQLEIVNYKLVAVLSLAQQISKTTVELKRGQLSELNVDNWNDNCEVKSEAKSHRPLRGLQVDFSLPRNVSHAVR